MLKKFINDIYNIFDRYKYNLDAYLIRLLNNSYAD